ncbi:hypothetical protein THAOC_19161, partial [Thalassiosira oceanica]
DGGAAGGTGSAACPDVPKARPARFMNRPPMVGPASLDWGASWSAPGDDPSDEPSDDSLLDLPPDDARLESARVGPGRPSTRATSDSFTRLLANCLSAAGDALGPSRVVARQAGTRDADGAQLVEGRRDDVPLGREPGVVPVDHAEERLEGLDVRLAEAGPGPPPPPGGEAELAEGRDARLTADVAAPSVPPSASVPGSAAGAMDAPTR